MIGIVIAIECEADILLRDMQIDSVKTHCGKTIYTGIAHKKELALIVCGVGKVNAALGAQILIDLYHAEYLINFGVAGGIRENTTVTDVYQIEKAVQYDFDLAELNKTKIGTLNELKENYLSLKTLPCALPCRKLATADRFNDNQADYLLIKDYMQADIRDMEGGAIAQVAIHAGIPCYEWKAISDKASNQSSFEQYNANKLTALEKLHRELPLLFALLPKETL